MVTGFKIVALMGAVVLLAHAPEVHASEVSGNDVVEASPDVEQVDQVEDESEVYSDNSVSDNNISYSDEESGSSDLGESSGSSVSDNNQVIIYDVQPLSDYDTYYGSISTTYVEYMRGYLSKVKWGDSYVGARTGQYEYIFAFGDLSFDGSVFSGFDITVCTWNTQSNGTFSYGVQSSFSLSPGSYLVYTDLSDMYPTLETSGDASLRQIVNVLGIVVTFYTVTRMMSSHAPRHSRSQRRRLR